MPFPIQIRPVAGFSAQELTQTAKLLLNGWAAEFALNVKPACADRAFLNTALSWSLPQAHYAALFSMRARLAIDHINLSEPKTIEKLMLQWARQGQFGEPATTNPFAELFTYANNGGQVPPRLSGPEIALTHVRLSTQVHALGIVNEAYIADRLGAATYEEWLDGVPSHLKALPYARYVLMQSAG